MQYAALTYGAMTAPPRKSALKSKQDAAELSPVAATPKTVPSPGRPPILTPLAGLRAESTLDKWHDDDLSIVASDDDDDDSSQSSRGHGSKQRSKTSARPSDLVRRETTAVRCLRWALLILLTSIAAYFTLGTFYWVEKAELWDAYASTTTETDTTTPTSTETKSSTTTTSSLGDGACEWDAEAVQDAWAEALEKSLLASHRARFAGAFMLSASLTSAAGAAVGNATPTADWPLYVQPDLDTLSAGLLGPSTGVSSLLVAPLVEPGSRRAFEAYAVERRDPGVAVIWDTDPSIAAPPGSTTLPVWQEAPDGEESRLLENLLADPSSQAAVDRVGDYGAGILTGFLADDPDDETTTPPIAALWYPVFRDFQEQAGDIVSYLRLELDWTSILRAALPFSFAPGGGLLGSDDPFWVFLEPSCDKSGGIAAFEPLTTTTEEGGSSSTTTGLLYKGRVPDSLPLDVVAQSIAVNLPGAYKYASFADPIVVFGNNNDDDICDYTVWVVPKQEVERAGLGISSSSSSSGTGGETDPSGEEEDSTPNDSRHVVLTVVAGLLFGILCGLFLAYDRLVERRQAVVINIANKSSAIVENLFPAQIRERMLENMQQKASAPLDAPKNLDSSPDGDGEYFHSGGPSFLNNGSHTPESSSQLGVGKGGDVLSSNSLPGGGANGAPGHVSVKQFLTSEPGAGSALSSQPIADLFPNTTVLFADISGFTAWSSQREPPQVFTLLETLYRSFDVIAKKLKVFKVETIGDCYMAVTGLPNPDVSHAVHMSRFAYQCLIGMKELIKELDGILGPGTSDLALRVGLHSGAVTAGVLRGEKSRFQLFGDTVNTASRMESTGIRGKIQVSQETADLLEAAGKAHWLKPREESIVAKGKGELKTYWLDPTKKRRHHGQHHHAHHQKHNNHTTPQRPKEIRVLPDDVLVSPKPLRRRSSHSGANPGGASTKPAPEGPATTRGRPEGGGETGFDEKYARLIDWNVDVLLHHLARVISSRSRNPTKGSLVNHSAEVALLPAAINDVAEVVALPPFDPDASRFRRARPDVSMLQQTRADLHEYVKRIALTYNDVPFHNFEHASHVTLCANKLMNRLINSDEYQTEEELHNATFGISSDPLTHFAIVFAALIHDVDHTGLPNAQLVKDGHEVARRFDNRSVAEQNSVHLGWEILMDPRFERLRKCIYQTNVERKRFRQLVINAVLSTDIADRRVNEDRQSKWDRAFESDNGGTATGLQQQEAMNRKATAVIEHIIQVSDVAHTMQHWHIYRRWNERLFHEMHEAYFNGRITVDPSTNWYIGELGFFDYFLIPLARKLKECGVFGASGNEYISYVLKNKKEWERNGKQVVQEMVLLYKEAEGDEISGSSFADSEEEYDSDDLEYDSPGDLSYDEEQSNEINSTDALVR